MSAATPPTAAQRRADALRRAAQAKRQAATARADAAIRQLVKNKQEINFRSVARTGGISIDFLYASAGLRHRIESLRTQQAAEGPFRPAQPETRDPEGSVVHILTIKLREERAARRTAEHDLQQRRCRTRRTPPAPARHGTARHPSPTIHVTDAIRNVTTRENVMKVKASAR